MIAKSEFLHMKKHLFLPFIFAVVLIACKSQSGKPTDEIVQEIIDAKDLKVEKPDVPCMGVQYNVDGDEIRMAFVESGMGDGGEDLVYYFSEGKMIFVKAHSFFESYTESADTAQEMHTVTMENYNNYYFENDKLVSCFKLDAKNNMKAEKVDIKDKEQQKWETILVEQSKKLLEAYKNKNFNILCD